jgi:hypothetical protein
MQRRLTAAPRWATAVLAVAALVLVILTAFGARRLPGSETRPPPFLIGIDVLAATRIVLGVLAGLAVLLVVLLLLPGGPPIKLPERKKSSPLRLLAGITLLFAIALLLQPLFNRSEQPPVLTGTGDSLTQTEISSSQESGSRWGLIILGGAVLLMMIGVAAATRPAVDPEVVIDPSGPAEVTGVIDMVLAQLEQSTDPRRVVIGAYARMERAFTASGLPRRTSEAPLEYLARALRRLAVSRSAVGRLTALFEVARFSHHEIDPDMGREAIAALNDIRSELSGVVS